jgi:hypothetical protein
VDNIVVRLAVKAAESRGKRGKKKKKDKCRVGVGDRSFPMRLVRLGHPARLLPQVLEHSLDALLQRSDETSE